MSARSIEWGKRRGCSTANRTQSTDFRHISASGPLRRIVQYMSTTAQRLQEDPHAVLADRAWDGTFVNLWASCSIHNVTHGPSTVCVQCKAVFDVHP